MYSKQILKQRITEIKEGDLLAFDFSSSFHDGAGYLVQFVTENAIKVDGDWIPKSQIVSITLGARFWEGIECKELVLSAWFNKKLESSRTAGYGW